MMVITAKLTVATAKRKQVVDITEQVQKLLEKHAVVNGLVTVTVQHTTAALTTADLDPGTDEDMLDAYGAMVPRLQYRHPHDPSHVGDHIMASLMGPSVNVPATEGKLILGTWQRIVLVELDGPRDRELTVIVVTDEQH